MGIGAMGVRRVVYVSRAAPGTSAAEVAAIIETSRRNNARDGVSGALVHGGGRFAQVLEAPEEAIAALLARIRADRRHQGIRILEDAAVPERAFTEWTMALLEDVAYLPDACGTERGGLALVLRMRRALEGMAPA